MFDFLEDIEYLRKRNNEEWYFFGKVDVPIPSWDVILKEIDKVYKNALENGEFEKNKIPLKDFYRERYTKSIEVSKHFSMTVWTDKDIPIIKHFTQSLGDSHNIRGNQNFSSQIFMSLTSVDSMFGKHRDEMDVWIWQLHGASKWFVEGRESDFNHNATSGDLLYIPRGLYHEITPLEPRVSISFASENHPIQEPQYLNNLV